MVSKRAKTLIVRSCLFFLCLLVGAAIFSSLEYVEQPSQYESKLEIVKQNLTLKYNITDDEILQLLETARKEELDALRGLEWNFSNSVFFAVTVVTTIGYGHISPRTWQGQLFCILYSIIGIPVAGLALKSVGEYITIWVNSTMAFFDQKVRKKDRPSKLNGIYCIIITCIFFIIMILVGTFLSSYYEGWTYMESAYATFITLSTIGFGDYVLNDGRLMDNDTSKTILLHLSIVYLLVGLGTLSALLCAVSDIIEQIADDQAFFETPARWGQQISNSFRQKVSGASGEAEGTSRNDIEAASSEDDTTPEQYEIRPRNSGKRRGLFILQR